MSHLRSQKTLMVRIEDIKNDEAKVSDPVHLKLVVRDLLGKLTTGLTRLHNSTIISGFFKIDNGQVVHIDEFDRTSLPLIIENIRCGFRPAVEVYWSSQAPHGGSYVCPDSQINLAAYRALNIEFIPTRILKPKNICGPEGVLWVELRSGIATITKKVAPKVVGYTAFAGMDGLKAKEYVSNLEKKCVDAGDLIKSFHLDGGDIHYHQMLHATVRRHSRSINSIGILIELGRLEHAAFVIRSCYEAFLNFYLDWLAPEFVGRRMQLLSAVRIANISEENLDCIGNFKGLFENVADKAHISCLGRGFYSSIYSSLSKMTHQSYCYIEREALDFSDKDDEPDSINQILLILNVITAVMIERVINDVGGKKTD